MTLEIIPYAKEHGPVFDRLNRAWIKEFFTVEPVKFGRRSLMARLWAAAHC